MTYIKFNPTKTNRVPGSVKYAFILVVSRGYRLPVGSLAGKIVLAGMLVVQHAEHGGFVEVLAGRTQGGLDDIFILFFKHFIVN